MDAPSGSNDASASVGLVAVPAVGASSDSEEPLSVRVSNRAWASRARWLSCTSRDAVSSPLGTAWPRTTNRAYSCGNKRLAAAAASASERCCEREDSTASIWVPSFCASSRLGLSSIIQKAPANAATTSIETRRRLVRFLVCAFTLSLPLLLRSNRSIQRVLPARLPLRFRLPARGQHRMQRRSRTGLPGPPPHSHHRSRRNPPRRPPRNCG